MNEFKLKAPYKPTGDQPQAIAELVKGFKEGNQCQTLLGVTGSGKTFTMANVIQQLQKPTLVIAHNKTLAAQLYGEFKEMFPDNAVEYFVSYYDYYQPKPMSPPRILTLPRTLPLTRKSTDSGSQLPRHFPNEKMLSSCQVYPVSMESAVRRTIRT